MDQTQQLLLLVGAATVGLVAVVLILRRQRVDAAPPDESPFAASTEGEKICLKCGMGNLWTDATCVACGSRLPG